MIKRRRRMENIEPISDIWLEIPVEEKPLCINLERDFCRCCHSEGCFVNLEGIVINDQGKEEIILELLKNFLDVDIPKVEGIYKNITYNICIMCMTKLREAISFKNRVLKCEERFREFCVQNNIKDVSISKENDVATKVSITEDDDAKINTDTLDAEISDGDEFMKIEPDIKIEFTNDTLNEPITEKIKKGKRKKSKQEKRKEPSKESCKNKLSYEQLREIIKTSEQDNFVLDNGVYRCCKCDVQEIQSRDIIRHVILAHRNDISDFIPSTGINDLITEEENKFICYICKKQHKDVVGARHHIRRTHLRLKSYFCDVCNMRFIDIRYVTAHKLKEHQIDERISCNACESLFNSKTQLDTHMKIFHMLSDVLKCTSCDYQCYGSAQMKKHKINHKVTRDHHCSFAPNRSKDE